MAIIDIYLRRLPKADSRSRFLHRMQRVILLPIRVLPNVSVEVCNHTKERFLKQAIVISNHQSVFDILLCISLCQKLTIVVKSEYKKSIVMRHIVKLAGYHFVSEDSSELFNGLDRDIQAGYSVLIFPEGTRTRTGALGSFHSGAFSLARYYSLDILPLVEHGAFEVLPKGHAFARSGKITIDIRERIHPDDVFWGKTIKQRTRKIEDYYRECLKDKPSCCVIGGGMGGLFTAAILSKEGYRVTVAEKNDIIGGGLQSFKRGEAVFNTGMHNFGGWSDEWALSHLLSYFGIKDQIQVMPLQEDAQEIVYTDTEHSYHLPKGRERFEAYLSALFPTQAQGLHQYLDTLFLIADSFDHYKMRRPEPHPEVKEYINLTVEQLIDRYISDLELKRVLSYMSPLCGHSIGSTSVSVHSMLSVLYLSGEYRFVDNAVQLAYALKHVIEAAGGHVLNNTEISQVVINYAYVDYLMTTDHRRLEADSYVGAIAPKVLFALSSQNVVRNISRRRADEFESDSSAFSIYIQLKPKSLKFINSTILVPNKIEDPDLPPYILLTTPPAKQQEQWAQTIEILVPTHYSLFKQWGDTKLRHRGKEYEQYKKQFANEIIDYLVPYIDLRSCIEHIYTATPLTIRDYYNNPSGAIFSQQGLFMPLRTRVDNLFLTGQSVLYHGLCGVPLTAILTAEAITQTDILSHIVESR